MLKTRKSSLCFDVTVFLSAICCILNQDCVWCYKICAHSQYEPCQQLERDGKLQCSNNFHSVDCLLKIEQDLSHLGKLSAEEAFLGGGVIDSRNVVVIGEVTNRNLPPATVVVVKNELPNNIEGLKGRKLCHPGYKNDDGLSNLMLQELELQIVNLLNQDELCYNTSAPTLTEKHISGLANFLGESCRPGLWTRNVDLDSILKPRYNSLCQLCGPNLCNVEYKNPLNDTLYQCLLTNNGDIAVTTLKNAQDFFREGSNAKNYKYFCKDGTTNSDSNPCIWTQQLPSVLVAHASAASEVAAYLRLNLKSKIQKNVDSSTLDQSLSRILDLQKWDTVVIKEPYVSLRQYVETNRTIPTEETSQRCDRLLKWCTYSDGEYQKCRWLQQAAMNRAIQPVVECTRSEDEDELSCINDVQLGNSDIVVASADYAYVTAKKNLKPIAFPETNSANLSHILVVKRRNDDSIKSFSDLRGKSICLPRYGDIEFIALTDKLSSVFKDVNSCNRGKFLSDIVGNSCTPGALDQIIHEATESVDTTKLCNKCEAHQPASTSVFCNADSRNKYFDSQGAIQCVLDGRGDYAVITRNGGTVAVNDSSLVVICKNGSLATYPGLNVNTDCALAVVTNSEIISKHDNEKNPDIILALYEFERWFGTDMNKPFQLFNVFNGTTDLLFKDSTPGLTFEKDDEYITNYKELVKRSNICPSSAFATISPQILYYFVLFLSTYILMN